MAAGNSPADDGEERRAGLAVSLDLSRRATGDYLDGAQQLSLAHSHRSIPAKNFWSVVVYDALSRSELQNGQPLPSVSVYSKPKVNDDGSVDIFFGPEEPKSKGNWIRTVPGQDGSRSSLLGLPRSTLTRPGR